MINELDYVELGLACADICRVLHRGMSEKGADGISHSVFVAIGELTT